MNHTDEIRVEVADRLRAIGKLGEHVAEDRVDMTLALETCFQLLTMASNHVNKGGRVTRQTQAAVASHYAPTRLYLHRPGRSSHGRDRPSRIACRRRHMGGLDE